MMTKLLRELAIWGDPEARGSRHGQNLGADFRLLRRAVRHGRLLMASVVSAMFGCLILSLTDNLFGAGSGILFVGAGFAVIYPLAVEMIGDRFPYYPPGVFNGIFSLAVTGGLLAPATLGYFATLWDIRVVMWLPLAGTFMVLILVLLIWLESKLSGRTETQ